MTPFLEAMVAEKLCRFSGRRSRGPLPPPFSFSEQHQKLPLQKRRHGIGFLIRLFLVEVAVKGRTIAWRLLR
jgi:hypothetical protein